MGKKSNAQLREEFFNLYALNLSLIDPSCADLFMCPLCRRLFDRGCLSGDALTLDHIVPKSLGGRHRTLMCKTCNNDLCGSKLEADLVRRFELEDKLSGVSDEPLRGDARIGGEVVTADWRFSVREFTVDGRINPPSSIEAISRLPDPVLEAFSPHIDFDQRNTVIAMLKIAYLSMFAFFGYDYILREPADTIRLQILAPSNNLSPLRMPLLTRVPEDMVEISLIHTPKELKSFFGVFHMRGRSIGVVLPGTEEDSVYGRWTSYAQNSPVASIQAKSIPYNRARLRDPVNCRTASLWWDSWLVSGS